MADYSQLKVPDLKKILTERGLIQSGNKADLIARLQEDDNKKPGGGATAGEDEIDWDEDDNKPTTVPAVPAAAAGGQGPISTPAAVPNQVTDVDPAKTTDLTVKGGMDAPKAADGVVASSGTTTEPATEPEATKEDFSIGLGESDAQKEAAKRAARAKRFGIPENEEAKKLADRAKKFALDQKDPVVITLDSALPERRAKRVREEKQGGRAAKRQTPDRRTEAKPKAAVAPQSKKPSKITDDPLEKAKAEERAKRFAKPAA